MSPTWSSLVSVSRWLLGTPWMEQEVEKEDVGWYGERDGLNYFSLTVRTAKMAIVCARHLLWASTSVLLSLGSLGITWELIRNEGSQHPTPTC